MLKRAIDIVVSLGTIVVLSPLIAALAILVKATSPGPILYRGLRAGRYGVPFRMMKFRSMVVDAERRGGPSTSEDDPRLTRVGSFMRRYKLDELPQLFNVLAGDMSIVGHRPEVLSEVAEYTAEQRRILDLRPGITDWASIWNADEGRVLAGSPDPHQAYKTLIQPTKLKLQLKYRDEHSLWIDLKVVGCTFLKMLMRNWTPSELRAFPPAGSRRGTTA